MTDFEHADLTGARFRKTRLGGAWFRSSDLSGAVLRDVSLEGASIDGAEMDGLRIDGIEVAPLIDAELNRAWPGRSLRRSDDPAELRAAWAALEEGWAAAYDRATGVEDVPVEDEWTFAQTVRHLVFVTDAWLGAALGTGFHPWGLPFSDVAEFADPAALGVDASADPAYADVLSVRAERVAAVRALLADAAPEDLAKKVQGPAWAGQEPLSILRCLRVVLSEEFDHLRFAIRDLDAIAAG